MATGTAWLFACASATRADDPHVLRRGVHRVKPLCSLPPADYQHGARSPSTIVRSQLAIPLTRPELVTQAIAAIRDTVPSETAVPEFVPRVPRMDASDVAGYPYFRQLVMRDQVQSAINAVSIPQAKLILLNERELSMMHCEISDVVVFVEATGMWHVSLRADQNPTSRRNDQERNLELQIKRNAFHVEIRLLHSSRGPGEAQSMVMLPPSAINQAGKLVVAQLQIDEFWVEREAPAFIKRQGYDRGSCSTFNLSIKPKWSSSFAGPANRQWPRCYSAMATRAVRNACHSHDEH